MRRRFIVCDGAELARFWARIGAGESEELTWVPREDESRARPAGFRALQGGLAADSLQKLNPKEGDDFALAGAIVQGILFGSTVGATALATDIENGFFDRLLSSPTTRPSIEPIPVVSVSRAPPADVSSTAVIRGCRSSVCVFRTT